MNPKFTKIRTSITQLPLEAQLEIHRGVQARRLIRREIIHKAKKKTTSEKRQTLVGKQIKNITDKEALDKLIEKLKADKAKQEIL